MRRGEVWWAELGPPASRRPVVLLSRDDAYAIRSRLTVAPVTTRQRGIPSEVALGPEEGLPRPCVANLDSITTIPKANLRERVAYLPLVKRLAIDDALIFALGLAE